MYIGFFFLLFLQPLCFFLNTCLVGVLWGAHDQLFIRLTRIRWESFFSFYFRSFASKRPPVNLDHRSKARPNVTNRGRYGIPVVFGDNIVYVYEYIGGTVQYVYVESSRCRWVFKYVDVWASRCRRIRGNFSSI